MGRSKPNNVDQLTFETYGRQDRFVWLDGPQAIVRLAVARFVADHTRVIISPRDGSTESLRPWYPLTKASQGKPAGSV